MDTDRTEKRDIDTDRTEIRDMDMDTDGDLDIHRDEDSKEHLAVKKYMYNFKLLQCLKYTENCGSEAIKLPT
jgi:hypothetical protein